MSSIFNNEVSDNVKKIGTSHGSGTNLAAASLALSPSTAPGIPYQQSDDDSIPVLESNTVESWVELAPSRASLCSSIEAVMVDSINGGDNSVNRDSRLSPVSLQSPHVEFESLEQVKYRLVKDMLPFAEGAKSTDWLWDWSTRSETGTGTQKVNRHRSGSGHIGSTLTTPPNSPEPESSEFEFKSKSSSRSIKKSAKKTSVFMRFDIFSNLVAFFVGATIGAAIGYYLSRKMALKNDSTVIFAF